jgi:hypothetical protein
MSRLILQPSSNKDARNHYEDTILNPVPFSRLEPYLTDDELSILRTFYPNEKCYVWGVTPGGKNKSSWDKIGRGDVAVFSKKGKIFASSVVTHKLHNMELAVDLWKYDRKGKTWEYIYFLDEIHNVNIPYVDFNRSVINKKGEPYADNYIIQGFTVLEPEQCLKFFEKFDLQSDIVVEAVDESKIYRILRELNKLENTDVEILSKKRLEQAYLKTLLFDSKTKGYCACCGKEYPVSYLVTAHIKKRAFCSLDERKDKNIVFPMCKMGCDEIFERGYVSVEEGRFVSLNKAPITDPLSTYIDAIVGNECPYYNEDTEEYFLWHIDFHLGR